MAMTDRYSRRTTIVFVAGTNINIHCLVNSAHQSTLTERELRVQALHAVRLSHGRSLLLLLHRRRRRRVVHWRRGRRAGWRGRRLRGHEPEAREAERQELQHNCLQSKLDLGFFLFLLFTLVLLLVCCTVACGVDALGICRVCNFLRTCLQHKKEYKRNQNLIN